MKNVFSAGTVMAISALVYALPPVSPAGPAPLPAVAPAVKGASDTSPLFPATAIWAMRGLTQTVSAEPMGEGRLTMSITPTWYGQEANSPLQKMNVLTGIMAFCYGLNPYIDFFGNAAGYGILGDSSSFGNGSVCLGLRGSLPLPAQSPLRLGVQMGFITGSTSQNLNENNSSGSYYRTNSDGYDYFETETKYDFAGRFMESFIFGTDSLGIKIHLNQGAAFMLQDYNRQLLLLGIGVQASVNPKIVLGLELNSRTNANNINITTDPLWLTPSILVRTPYYFNALLGADVSMSSERTATGARALEPFRLFGSFAFSVDVLAAKRRAEREKSAAQKEEWKRKIKEARERSEVIASMARVDSSARANVLDSLKRKKTMMVQKAREDSLKIVDLKRKLIEERSKRPDVEKQLLSKGLLLLDAVYFETGKAQISINSYPYLNIIGKMLAKYPKLQIEVAGHTDNIGRYEKNITLSQDRAEAVRRYLIQVAPDLLTRISARGYGPTQPKATNTTRDGRKLNRRTELQVLNKEVLKEYN
jgi:outer membrane protein OmpA-like peptidoglycan-associated protein